MSSNWEKDIHKEWKQHWKKKSTRELKTAFSNIKTFIQMLSKVIFNWRKHQSNVLFLIKIKGQFLFRIQFCRKLWLPLHLISCQTYTHPQLARPSYNYHGAHLSIHRPSRFQISSCKNRGASVTNDLHFIINDKKWLVLPIKYQTSR